MKAAKKAEDYPAENKIYGKELPNNNMSKKQSIWKLVIYSFIEVILLHFLTSSLVIHSAHEPPATDPFSMHIIK